MRAGLALGLLLTLAACQQADETPSGHAGEAVPAEASAVPAAPANPATPSVLNERENPDRVLAWFSEQLTAGKWDDAA
ncbi:MAG TPA: hypothetical protein VL017_04390, partial [Devosia sp.]|nr:hypothetical protein [Devosia sp.]